MIFDYNVYFYIFLTKYRTKLEPINPAAPVINMGCFKINTLIFILIS